MQNGYILICIYILKYYIYILYLFLFFNQKNVSTKNKHQNQKKITVLLVDFLYEPQWLRIINSYQFLKYIHALIIHASDVPCFHAYAYPLLNLKYLSTSVFSDKTNTFLLEILQNERKYVIKNKDTTQNEGNYLKTNSCSKPCISDLKKPEVWQECLHFSTRQRCRLTPYIRQTPEICFKYHCKTKIYVEHHRNTDYIASQ